MDIYIHNTPAPDKNRDEGIVRTISNNGVIRSSARALRRSVKSGNERNPCCQLQVSGETAGVSRRKEGITSNQHGPLMPWATHVLQWKVQWAANPQGGANPIKTFLSSD